MIADYVCCILKDYQLFRAILIRVWLDVPNEHSSVGVAIGNSNDCFKPTVECSKGLDLSCIGKGMKLSILVIINTTFIY